MPGQGSHQLYGTKFIQLDHQENEQPDYDRRDNKIEKTSATTIYFDSENVRNELYKAIIFLQGVGKNYLNQYNIGRMLGQGALGTVFRAQHKLSKLQYAIKFVKHEDVKQLFGNDASSQFNEYEIMKCMFEKEDDEESKDDENYSTTTNKNIIELVEGF